ncbi:uncharacterized protein LOC143355893 [Halictus rubicundus]|uniref:uncharacterized protein LOC143355893 n=1 Tax=Halictus rubicundus TaxID=77578 RepID=UPI004036BD02
MELQENLRSICEQNLLDMITVLEEIDQKMDTIGLPKQHWSQCKYQMFIFCEWLVYILVHVTVEWKFSFTPFIPVFDKILLSLSLNAVPILTMTTYLSFSIWIRYIQTKLSQLNYLMEEMIDSSGPKRFLQITDCQIKRGRCMNVRLVKGNVQIIMKAKECHLELVRIARRVNKYFGMNLLSSLTTSITIIIAMLYTINFSIWYSLSGDDLLVDTFPLVIWILMNTTAMIHLYWYCMHTSNEAGKAGYLLCRLYDSSTSMEFRIEVQRFTQQVQQNPLVFNVCGLVDIDDTFLTSTVGWVFTYIVVILQLQTQSMQQKLDANSTSVVKHAI